MPDALRPQIVDLVKLAKRVSPELRAWMNSQPAGGRRSQIARLVRDVDLVAQSGEVVIVQEPEP